MEKKWDTLILADLERLFVSGTYVYVPLVTKGLNLYSNFLSNVEKKAEVRNERTPAQFGCSRLRRIITFI